VGIGTASPQTSLEIFKSVASGKNILHVYNNSAGASSTVGIGWSENDATNGNYNSYLYTVRTPTNEVRLDATTDKRFVIRTGTGGSNPTERMTVLSDGNIGIGNTAPTALLALSTGSGAGSDATSTGTLQIRQASTGLANGGGLEFHASTFGSGYGFKWSAIDSSGVHLVLGSRENSATWTERLRITTAGNVGIGTTSPNNKLHIRNTAGSGVQTPVLQLTDTGSALNNGAVIDFSYATTNILNARIGALSVVGGGGALTFAVAASDGAATSEYMRITKAGNVGIGTTSPVEKVYVSDGLNEFGINPTTLASPFNAVNGTSLDFRFTANGNTNARFAAIVGALDAGSAGNNSGHLEFWTAPTGSGNPAIVERMRILTNGNVGIGTTSPTAPLTVFGAGNSAHGTIRLVGGANNNTTYWQSITSRQYDTTNESEGFVLLNAVYGASDNTLNLGGGLDEFNTPTVINFYTAANVSTRTGTVRMSITGAGNVGIGTTSPAAKLDVIGTQKLINSVVVNSSTQTIVTNPSDGIAGLCWIRNADVGGQALVLWDASFGLTIVSQLGSIFTTGSPSATQIQLSLGGSNPYYIQAIAGSSRNGNTLRTSAINNH
jgi:hypothetical protein